LLPVLCDSPAFLIGQSPHLVKPGSSGFVFIATASCRYHSAEAKFASKKLHGPNLARPEIHYKTGKFHLRKSA
jgi:hypothetical protein